MLDRPSMSTAPIVLIHGLGGFDLLFRGRVSPPKEMFPGVRAHLNALGYEVYAPRLSPTASIRTRANELAEYLRREVGHKPVHLIGHSMGGLDARYLITQLGFSPQVLSLTTIGTPHRGSTFADWVLNRFGRWFLPLLRWAKIPHAAFHDLTTTACAEFNQQITDVPTVRYLSVAGVCEPEWLSPGWRVSSGIVAPQEGPNDGIVSQASATWGAERLTWRGDHLNLVNWPNRKMAKQGTWPDRMGEYTQLLNRLHPSPLSPMSAQPASSSHYSRPNRLALCVS